MKKKYVENLQESLVNFDAYSRYQSLVDEVLGYNSNKPLKTHKTLNGIVPILEHYYECEDNDLPFITEGEETEIPVGCDNSMPNVQQPDNQVNVSDLDSGGGSVDQAGAVQDNILDDDDDEMMLDEGEIAEADEGEVEDDAGDAGEVDQDDGFDNDPEDQDTDEVDECGDAECGDAGMIEDPCGEAQGLGPTGDDTQGAFDQADPHDMLNEEDSEDVDDDGLDNDPAEGEEDDSADEDEGEVSEAEDDEVEDDGLDNDPAESQVPDQDADEAPEADTPADVEKDDGLDNDPADNSQNVSEEGEPEPEEEAASGEEAPAEDGLDNDPAENDAAAEEAPAEEQKPLDVDSKLQESIIARESRNRAIALQLVREMELAGQMNMVEDAEYDDYDE